MFFRKSDKAPLEYALDFIHLAEESARRYWHDKQYVPTEEVMQQLRELERAVWLLHCFLGYIISNLSRRADGKPEEPATFVKPPDTQK